MSMSKTLNNNFNNNRSLKTSAQYIINNPASSGVGGNPTFLQLQYYDDDVGVDDGSVT